MRTKCIVCQAQTDVPAPTGRFTDCKCPNGHLFVALQSWLKPDPAVEKS